MKFIVIIFMTMGIVNFSSAQTCIIKLSGHIEDADTKEKLAGATVLLKETNKQIITNENGDFEFTGICSGNYTVEVSHISCETIQQTIVLEKDKHIDIFLPHTRATLGAVVVEGLRGIQNTGFKKELSGEELEKTRGLSFSEALSKINGVNLLQTGSTISKPVIHGLHGNRILTINNGVRQEGQQWGNEHAPEIDPFIANKLIVINGVDVLKYGSDAIGGVILVEPKALRNQPGYSAELNTGYFTNNRQYLVSGVWEQQFKKHPVFSYRLQGTYKKGANAATPDYRLNNTGSEEKNFSITAGWKKEKFNTEFFYSVFHTQVGIFKGSHIGNLTDLQNAIAAPRPDNVFLGQDTYEIQRPYQDVLHHLLKLKSLLIKGAHKFNIQIAGQYNHRQEFDIVRSSTNTKPQLNLSIYSFSEDFSWEHPVKNFFSGTVGVSMMQQDNSYSGRYFIPNYFSYSFGAYAIEKWSRHRWELQGGIRYDYKNIDTRRLRFNSDTINHEFNFATLASSFNAAYKPDVKWKINLNISLASRAPHVNELLSDGIHHGTATYEKGNINLRPEQSVNISSGISFQNTLKTFSAELNLYSNNISHFIYQQPMPENPVLTIAGAFPLLEYKQTNAALNGLDASAMFTIYSGLQLETKYSMLYARNKTADDWLILMPPNRLSNELTYHFSNFKKISDSYVSAEIVHVMKQTRVPDEKNGKQDYKAPPPSYTLLNLNAAATFKIRKLPLTASLSARNVLNTSYRDYLNSLRYFIDEMGRNIGLRLKVSISDMLMQVK